MARKASKSKWRSFPMIGSFSGGCIILDEVTGNIVFNLERIFKSGAFEFTEQELLYYRESFKRTAARCIKEYCEHYGIAEDWKPEKGQSLTDEQIIILSVRGLFKELMQIVDAKGFNVAMAYAVSYIPPVVNDLWYHGMWREYQVGRQEVTDWVREGFKRRAFLTREDFRKIEARAKSFDRTRRDRIPSYRKAARRWKMTRGLSKAQALREFVTDSDPLWKSILEGFYNYTKDMKKDSKIDLGKNPKLMAVAMK